MRIADADVETVRLEPGAYVVWEASLIVEDGTEYLWQIRPDLGHANQRALEVGRYHERIHPDLRDAMIGSAMRLVHPAGPGRTTTGIIANEIAALTLPRDGIKCRLAGSKPSFDGDHLDAMLRRQGQCGSWYHHGMDVPSMVEGWCAARGITPRGARSSELSLDLGIDPNSFDRHTALGDARWTRAMRLTMLGGAPATPTAHPVNPAHQESGRVWSAMHLSGGTWEPVGVDGDRGKAHGEACDWAGEVDPATIALGYHDRTAWVVDPSTVGGCPANAHRRGPASINVAADVAPAVDNLDVEVCHE